MATVKDLADIQKLIANSIDGTAVGDKNLAGIIGDGPSHYSKSPALWNAAFTALGMNAIYLPFDVADAQVGELLGVLRATEGFMGINVTVPHKVRVMELLDAVDPGAARIGAVNTIVKTSAGKLVGYNTDGEGFVESILTTQPGQTKAFMNSLDGVDVLLLGAGGSARAVAYHVSDRIGAGKLIIANRTREHGEALAGEIHQAGREALAIDEKEISQWAPRVGLIVNSSTKGQGGIRQLANGLATILEPYSALAPANPPSLKVDLGNDFEQRWRAAAQTDIEANHRASETLVQTIPPATRFYDLIYHPEETVFLRHGRATGHRTMNGKSMIVCQAVIAFCKRICQRQLSKLNKDNDATIAQVAEVMYRAW
ncbi:MAG: shikimate dehydrogenase [Deltaproteobacteria bacterium]|nr:shikimate dehydrogenase [Deltaproteobacteria bacterium]